MGKIGGLLRRYPLQPPLAMGMLTDRVGLTGQTMVSKKQEKVEPLTFCQVLKTAYKGQWLTLEDDIGSIRDALITEQVNIGLLSALILTITFAYQFEVQGLDWDYIELQWGPTNASTVNMAFRGKASALSGQARPTSKMRRTPFVSSTAFMIASL